MTGALLYAVAPVATAADWPNPWSIRAECPIIKELRLLAKSGWNQFAPEEQLRLARQIWDLRGQLDVMSWLGSQEFVKQFGVSAKFLRTTVQTAGKILARS